MLLWNEERIEVRDSKFELQFAGFLDASVDVNRFIKNYIQLGFKMEYVNHEGGISNYYPDFVVHLDNGERFIVETKGAENLDDPRKMLLNILSLQIY